MTQADRRVVCAAVSRGDHPVVRLLLANHCTFSLVAIRLSTGWQQRDIPLGHLYSTDFRGFFFSADFSLNRFFLHNVCADDPHIRGKKSWHSHVTVYLVTAIGARPGYALARVLGRSSGAEF